jgi:hypothetical protein
MACFAHMIKAFTLTKRDVSTEHRTMDKPPLCIFFSTALTKLHGISLLSHSQLFRSVPIKACRMFAV